MDHAAKPIRHHRTITVNCRDEAPYFALLGTTKAFVAFVLAFLLALGVQLTHTASCRAAGSLTRHSHDARIRLGGLTRWRVQCTACTAVCTVLPPVVLRYRSLRPEVAREALLATHGGLSWELCAIIPHLAPMALDRLVCAFGQQRRVKVLTRCRLPLPTYVLAAAKHRRCLTENVSLPTIISGRVIWPLGYTEHARAAALTESSGTFHRAASQQEPSYRVRGILTDGFDRTTKSLRTLFPGARRGNGLRHAINKLPKPRAASALPVRQALRSQVHTLLHHARQRTGLRVFALGQRLRHCAGHVMRTAGAVNGERVRRGFQDKKAGWYAVLEAPRMPATSTRLDQAHHAIERKLCMMKGCHHPRGSQQAFLTGLAHVYNLVPYQRRAKHAGPCGVEVEGGTVPTRDWCLTLQMLTSGGFR
jgi:hypothetical protein